MKRKRKVNPNWIDKDYGYEPKDIFKSKLRPTLQAVLVNDWFMEGMVRWAVKNQICLLDRGRIGDCGWPDGEACKGCLEEMAIENREFPLDEWRY